MAATHVVRATLTAGGQRITNFKGVTDRSRAVHKSIPLMYSTGYAALTQRFAVELDYVVPTAAPATEPVWDTIGDPSNSTAEIDILYDGATEPVRFGGVYVLESGDAKIDGENEVVRTITFGARSRNGDFGAGASLDQPA